jgi:hypothetical protein
MAYPVPGPRCIFCGEKANSREHTIPKWIGKRFGIRAIELRPAYTLNITPYRHRPIRFGSHRRRIFCAECNAHFKHLEDEAIPIIEAMGRGRSLVLGPTEQEIIARWGAKTGYALIAAEKDLRGLVPTEHTRILREQGQVHPLTWVGYASWEGHTHVFGGDHGIKIDEGRVIRVYGAILTFAQLALKVFGLYEAVPHHIVLFDTENLKQVSPRLDRRIVWPLWPAAQDGNLQQMAQLPPLTPTSQL